MGLIADIRKELRAFAAGDVGGGAIARDATNNPLSWNDFVNFFSFNGTMYGASSGGGGLAGNAEQIGQGFAGYVNGMLRQNGIVFTCMAIRLRVFSDIRFQYREINNGRPGRLYGGIDGRNPASRGLSLLNVPWVGGTTGDLLAHMVQDVDLAGNAFVQRQANRLYRLRPDWVQIVVGTKRKGGSPWDLDADVLGYIYTPGGQGGGADPIPLLAEEVAHWAPFPDPLSPRRGMSWLTPIVREVMADTAATVHKGAFFENDATVKNVMEFPPGTALELYNAAKDSFREQHEGAANAYKTLFLLGATAHTIGANFQQMDFKAVQGAGETRIATAAGLNAVIASFSEGLQGSALNAGNYASARRAVADMTFRPLWRNACGSLQHVIGAPSDAELWYDDRDCMFLQEDRKDAALIQQTQAQTIKVLIDSGYESASVVEAVMAEDMSLLKHTGLFSVQLQAPGSTKMPEGEAAGEVPVAGNGGPAKPAVPIAPKALASLPGGAG